MKITRIRDGFLPLVEMAGAMARLEAEYLGKPEDVPADVDDAPVHDDAPLRIMDLLRLPEFRGALSERAIRAAIASGDLSCERYGRRIVVTPRAAREWRDRCRDQVRGLGFGSSPKRSTGRQDASGSGQSGSSEMERSRSSLAALRLSARKLNRP